MQLLNDNITKTCKHGSKGKIPEINSELKHIPNELSIGNCIKCMKKREAFIVDTHLAYLAGHMYKLATQNFQ